MPIKVFWGKEGPYAIADSPSEAAELMRLASNGNKPTVGAKKHLPIEVEPIEPKQAFRATLKELGRETRKFLIALSNHNTGVRGPTLKEESNVDPVSFGAIMTNIAKAAQKHALKREDFLSSEVHRNGKTRERFFTPGPLLQKYGAELKG